jgi:hypothetical protein
MENADPMLHPEGSLSGNSPGMDPLEHLVPLCRNQGRDCPGIWYLIHLWDTHWSKAPATTWSGTSITWKPWGWPRSFRISVQRSSGRTTGKPLGSENSVTEPEAEMYTSEGLYITRTLFQNWLKVLVKVLNTTCWSQTRAKRFPWTLWTSHTRDPIGCSATPGPRGRSIHTRHNGYC